MIDACASLMALVAIASAHAPQDGLRKELPIVFTETALANWVDEKGLMHDPRYARNFVGTDETGLRAIELVGALQRIADDFRARPWPLHGVAKHTIQDQFDLIAGDALAAWSTAVPDGVLDSAQEESDFLAVINQRGRTLNWFQPTPLQFNGDVWSYFVVTEDGAGAFIPYRIDPTKPATPFELLVTEDEMTDFRLRADAIGDLLARATTKLVFDNVQSFKNAVEQWDNYLDRGYSQFPWESWVNGKLFLPKVTEIGPPSQQLVLLHPTLGIEVDTHSLDELRVKEALNIELLGYVWYTGDKYEHFWGGSLTMSVREDINTGFGALFHAGNSFNIGVSWHDLDDDGAYFDDRPFIFCSLDLFRFVESRGQEFEERYQSVKRRAGSLLGG